MRRFYPLRAPGRAWLLGLIVAGLMCCLSRHVLAELPTEAEEYEAKTALLYAFAKFVTWPDDAFDAEDSPFVFGVIGESPISGALEALVGKRIHGRPIEIRHFEGAADFEPCQLLLCELEVLEGFSRLHPHLLDDHHVLTAGETEGFADRGGVVCLTFVDDHLGFKINAAAARRAQVELSSSLFKLAMAVIDDGS